MVKREKEGGSPGGEISMSPEEQITLLRGALQQVEFVMTYVNEANVYPRCPWCRGDQELGHRDNCARQVALGLEKPSHR